MIERLRAAKTGETYTPKEIHAFLEEIFKADPQLLHRVVTLAKTPQRMTDKQAVSIFEIFYDLKRTSERRDGEKVNVYCIESCDPLAKFDAVALQDKYVLTHFSGYVFKKIDVRSESEQNDARTDITLETSDLTEEVSQDFYEYEEELNKSVERVF